MPGTDSAGHASPGAPDAGRLEIRVLGPLELAWDGRIADIGGVKARALVARLLIDRGLAVSVDRLVDSLWGSPRRGRRRDRPALDDLAGAQAPARRRRTRGPHRRRAHRGTSSTSRRR